METAVLERGRERLKDLFEMPNKSYNPKERVLYKQEGSKKHKDSCTFCDIFGSKGHATFRGWVIMAMLQQIESSQGS
jgi:hypothetical protein